MLEWRRFKMGEGVKTGNLHNLRSILHFDTPSSFLYMTRPPGNLSNLLCLCQLSRIGDCHFTSVQL